MLPLPHESELVSPLFKPYTGFRLKTKPDSDDLTPVPPPTLSPSPTPAYSPAATGASFLLLKQTLCPLRSLCQAVTSSGRPTLISSLSPICISPNVWFMPGLGEEFYTFGLH